MEPCELTKCVDLGDHDLQLLPRRHALATPHHLLVSSHDGQCLILVGEQIQISSASNLFPFLSDKLQCLPIGQSKSSFDILYEDQSWGCFNDGGQQTTCILRLNFTCDKAVLDRLAIMDVYQYAREA